MEIDTAGNASYSMPLTALSGFDLAIPGGSFSATTALGWHTSTGLNTDIFSGISYSNFALVSLQMKNVLSQFDIEELGGIKFRGPLTNFNLSETGEILMSSGVDGFVWKLKVAPTGALTIEQQNGRTSKFEISEVGSLEFTNALAAVSVEAGGTIELKNAAGTISMQPGGHIDVDGKTQGVNVGSGGLEPFMLGNKLKTAINSLIDETAKIIVPTAAGPSKIPENSEKILAIKSQVAAALSQFNKVS